MGDAGLVEIGPWVSDVADCASNPISVNLQGSKPVLSTDHNLKIHAIMSVPRLGFMENFFSTFGALLPLGIPIAKFSGVFWDQALERAFEHIIDSDFDAILTIDYDSVYSPQDLARLVKLLNDNPQADAIFPVQAHRANHGAM